MISARTVPSLIGGIIPVLLCMLVGFAGTAHAHIGGASFAATTSPYVIDVGYDPVQFTADQSTRFDFVLSDEKTNERRNFDQVWVRITNEDGTLLATGLFRQPFGPTTLLYVFAKPGAYTIASSFRDASGNEIAAASFPLTVTAGEGQSQTSKYALYLGLFIAGIALGAGGAQLLKPRR